MADASLYPNIVLTSQTIGGNGFQVHGIFPSFVAAVKHMAKDEQFSESLTSMVVRDAEHTEELYEFVRSQKDGTEVYWTVSKQPIRME